jgi:hypothetical protein
VSYRYFNLNGDPATASQALTAVRRKVYGWLGLHVAAAAVTIALLWVVGARRFGGLVALPVLLGVTALANLVVQTPVIYRLHRLGRQTGMPATPANAWIEVARLQRSLSYGPRSRFTLRMVYLYQPGSQADPYSAVEVKAWVGDVSTSTWSQTLVFGGQTPGSLVLVLCESRALVGRPLSIEAAQRVERRTRVFTKGNTSRSGRAWSPGPAADPIGTPYFPPPPTGGGAGWATREAPVAPDAVRPAVPATGRPPAESSWSDWA